MPEDNVEYLRMTTRLDIPADRVLDNAPRNMQGVVLAGWDEDGDFYFAASYADGGDVVWLLEMAKKKLLEMGDA